MQYYTYNILYKLLSNSDKYFIDTHISLSEKKIVIAHISFLSLMAGRTRQNVCFTTNTELECDSVLSQIVRYTSTNIHRTTACTRISCMMTNRASTKREPLIHQHQAGIRASCGPWAFHTVDRITFLPSM